MGLSFEYICLWIISIGYFLILLATTAEMSAIYVETELPLLYDKDTFITDELFVTTQIQCGRNCQRTGCSSFLFKSNDFDVEQHCYQTASHNEYAGTINTTITGRVCQNWAEQTPHAHHIERFDHMMPENNLTAAKNYCRDPDGEGHNWCYTTDPNSRWEWCDVGRCIDSGKNCRLYSISGNSSASRTGYQYFLQLQ